MHEREPFPPPPALPPSVPAADDSTTWRSLRPVIGVVAALAALLLQPADLVSELAIAAALVVVLVVVWPRTDGRRGRVARGMLFAGGLGALAALFASTNPWYGLDDASWPWEYFAQPRAWQPRLDIVLFTVVALASIVVALVPRARWLAGPLLAAVVLLAARAQSASGVFSLVRVSRVTFLWTLSAGALGAALVHVGSGGTSRLGTARILLVASVLGIVSVYAGWFPDGQGGRSSFLMYAEQLPELFAGALQGAEMDPLVASAMHKQLWSLGLPFLLQVVSLVLALVVAAFAVGARPFVRWLAAVAWLALLLTWLVPARADLWFHRDELAARGFTRVEVTISDALMKAGLVVWLWICGATALLLRAPSRDDVRAELAPPRARTAWRSALYVAAAALTVVVIATSFHPERGFVVHATPAQVLALGAWVPPFASLVFLAGFALVAFACAFLPAGRPRGVLGLVGAALAIGALSPDAHRSVGGVETYVAPVAAAVAAAACASTGRAARSVARAAAFLVVALLLYPFDEPVQARRDGTIVTAFRTGLIDVGVAPLFTAESATDFLYLLILPARLFLLSLAATVATAWMAVTTRRRGFVRAAEVTFIGGVVLAPVVAQVLGAGGGGLPGSSIELLWRIGTTLSVHATAYYVALFVAVRDLATTSRHPEVVAS